MIIRHSGWPCWIRAVTRTNRGAMHSRFLLFSAALLAFSLLMTACANLTSIERRTKFGTGGKAIHLDAKQRVVLTKAVKLRSGGELLIACAEPSPDALSALSASAAGAFRTPTTGTASFAAALSEAAGSIGLRTQSIQLMRDALYRVCEAYYGRALNQAMLMQLHERYQDILVAILAIEQLTGAVVANQVILSGNTAANASVQLLDLQRKLDEMIAREREKTQTADIAEENAKKAKALAQEAEALAQEAEALARGAEAPGEEADGQAPAPETPPAETAENTLGDRAVELREKADASNEAAKTAKEDAKSARDEAESATKDRKAMEKARDAVTVEMEITATSTGEFAPKRSGGLDSVSSAKIADAVKEIVKSVVDKDHLRDSCLIFLSSRLYADQDENQTRDFCENYLSQSNL